ncbi:MAG: hydrogenase expression/formation protein HypE [Chitinivibrionia bacterium]|nr:hydrogenase expression/formation protein HypE [Chitinivibrionia bacterium]
MSNEGNSTSGCPLPLSDYPRILLAHGGGGELMHRLIEDLFIPSFANGELNERHDGAVLNIGGARLAFTTDSYVVKPLFFPGGDIGTLAVYGTVNDLAMCGAKPVCLSAGFILEEGVPMDTLRRVVDSMRGAARASGVRLVTGDTKVVDRGSGDGMFITTAGIGTVAEGVAVSPSKVRIGDVVLLSGDIGRHGIAIMAKREGLAFETAIESDCAPLHGIAGDLLAAGIGIRCMRDLTRGGLASAAIEIAETAGVCIALEAGAIPVREDVRGACELLGFDPLYVANEGRFIAFVSPGDADRALAVMRAAGPDDAHPARIGRVEEGRPRSVVLTNMVGTRRVISRLSGEQLPRIC